MAYPSQCFTTETHPFGEPAASAALRYRIGFAARELLVPTETAFTNERRSFSGSLDQSLTGSPKRDDYDVR